MKGQRRATVELRVTVRNGAVLVRLIRALAVTAEAIGTDVVVVTDQPDNRRVLDGALPGWVWRDDVDEVGS